MAICIGVDGGGTKAAYRLHDTVTGKTEYLRIDGGVNPNERGFEASAASVVAGIRTLCAANGIADSGVSSVFAGIAGASSDDYRGLLKRELDSAFPASVNAVNHDGENILAAAFGDGDGVILICGTGSCCFARSGGKVHRIGGYLTFDLDGSGYEMGRRVIAHALMAYDGRKAPGVLSALADEKAGGSCFASLSALLSAPRKDIAAYSVLAVEAAEKGDTDAISIIEGTAEYLADCAVAAGRFYRGNYRICIAGGIGTCDITVNAIRRKLPERCGIFALKAPPVDGALYIAEHQLGLG